MASHCLVCKKVIAMMKKYNVKRHYETLHKMQYDEYHGKTRIEIADCLKRNIKNRRKF